MNIIYHLYYNQKRKGILRKRGEKIELKGFTYSLWYRPLYQNLYLT